MPQFTWIALVFVITWVAFGYLLYIYRRESRALREALRGSSGDRLEELLVDQGRLSERLQTTCGDIEDRVEGLERWSLSAKSNIGVVRYDAFDDVGGRLSFAIAVLNEHRDGTLITCVSGRDQQRIYAKEISSGECEQQLSVEEQEAMTIAVRGAYVKTLA